MILLLLSLRFLGLSDVTFPGTPRLLTNLLNARLNASDDKSSTISKWTARIVAQVKSEL